MIVRTIYLLWLQASLDWEPVSDTGNRGRPRRKSSTAHSEAEADSLRHESIRSRCSTMTAQQRLVDNDNGEVSLVGFLILLFIQ